MYQLNIKEFMKLKSASCAPHRFWLRLWVDSLHVGTHVHWAACPLSVPTLAYFWKFILRQPTRFTGRQKTALKAMARRRQNHMFAGQMPEFSQPDTVWNDFFDLQRSSQEELRKTAVEWHLNDLHRESNLRLITAMQASLISLLGLRELSTDQLFRGVSKIVLDADNHRASSVDANLVSLLEFYRDLPAREFISYTKLRIFDGVKVPTSIKRRWSEVRAPTLDSVHEAGTHRVLLGPDLDPYVVTRICAAGGVAERHRREGKVLYALRLQEHPQLRVYHFPPRSYFRVDEPGAPEKYHDVDFKRLEIKLAERGDEAGALLVERAMEELIDDPEESLRNLMVGAEVRWRRSNEMRHTDDILRDAYRWGLRRKIGEDFALFLKRAQGIGRDPRFSRRSVLGVLADWNWKQEKDFALLHGRLSEVCAGDDDELTPLRLGELVNWYSEVGVNASYLYDRCNTWYEIADLIALARGVRNSATHSRSDDYELYGAKLYLAKVVIEAFGAAWVRDRLQPSHASPTFVREAAREREALLMS